MKINTGKPPPKKNETKATHPINFPGSELFQNKTKEAHHTNKDTTLIIYICT